MKKTIVAVAVVVLVVVAAIPFANGLLMERTVRAAFQDLNSMYTDTGSGYSLAVIQYDRGYLTSDITWKIDLGALKTVYPIEAVVFKDHARHGFASVVATTSLEENPWFADFVADELQGLNPMHISTVYGLVGSIETTVALDAFSIAVEGETLDVEPANLVMATDRKLKRFTSSGTWQGLAVGDKLSIGKVFLGSNLEMLSTFLWDGEVNFGVQNVSGGANAEQFELQGMKGHYLFNVNDDRTVLSGEALFSIDSLVAKDTTVNGASARFAVDGLNVKGYEAFMRMYAQSMSGVFNRMGSLKADDEEAGAIMKQQMAAMGFQMMAAYEKLLKQGLAFRISDLRVGLADGTVTGDMTLRLMKDMTFMQFAPVLMRPELLLDIFYLKSEVSLPLSLAGEDPRLLAPVYPGMQTGLFVKSGDTLVHKAETVNGRLVVNSEEVNLSR